VGALVAHRHLGYFLNIGGHGGVARGGPERGRTLRRAAAIHQRTPAMRVDPKPTTFRSRFVWRLVAAACAAALVLAPVATPAPAAAEQWCSDC
jgi:hypothetical protein